MNFFFLKKKKTFHIHEFLRLVPRNGIYSTMRLANRLRLMQMLILSTQNLSLSGRMACIQNTITQPLHLLSIFISQIILFKSNLQAFFIGNINRDTFGFFFLFFLKEKKREKRN
jgi:hypothetical protein